MSASVDLEREKASSLSRLASAAYLAYAPQELKEKIGEQEARIILLQNEVKLAELKNKLDGSRI